MELEGEWEKKNKVIINFKVFVILTRVNFVDADRLIYDQMLLVSSISIEILKVYDQVMKPVPFS